MQIIIDHNKCIACGLCEENLPEIFILKNQVANLIKKNNYDEYLDEIKNCQEDCPAEAISIIEIN